MFRQNLFGDDFDTMVESFIDDIFSAPADALKKMAAVPTMRTDIRETEEQYIFEINLPGYKKEDLKLELKEGSLTVTAEAVKADEDENRGKYLRRERYTGKCQRSFYVGEKVRQEDIRAAFENGILKVMIPKEVPQDNSDFSINID